MLPIFCGYLSRRKATGSVENKILHHSRLLSLRLRDVLWDDFSRAHKEEAAAVVVVVFLRGLQVIGGVFLVLTQRGSNRKVPSQLRRVKTNRAVAWLSAARVNVLFVCRKSGCHFVP